MAHELNNCLATLFGSSRLLQTKCADVIDDYTMECVNIIGNSASRCKTIVNELLLLSSVKVHQIELRPLDMPVIIDEAICRLKNMINKYDAVIDHPGSWPAAKGHAPWVEEVWCNYISNAIKYGGEPPQITLFAERHNDELVKFGVKDNGSGVPADIIDDLFKPVSDITHIGPKGYGLGLSIVSRIVNKLGGEVWAENNPLHGSGFYFTLSTHN